ncbi:hypothetical protein ACJDU8_18215 [Clostridium sp. WILCCON 0269]|uniref:Uncharacterized protein n=1 Tax=Candidatus Clostridium eludens TaxID=3381663 RepID=A0ABW8SN34_9CLOT
MWIIIATTVYVCIMSVILALCKAASIADEQDEGIYSEDTKEVDENQNVRNL